MSAILLLLVLWAAGQAPPGQIPPSPPAPSRPTPRDQRQAAQTGTSVIKGRVLASDTGRPLRRALITVTSPALGAENRTASTGLDGRYEIKALPAGRYTLRVRRSGYLGLQYGQRRPLEVGKPLQIADKETADHIDFALPRTGVVAGRVTDELGEPIAGVTVHALRSVWFEGRRQLSPDGSNAITDEDGEYRLVGLNPATYYVRAVSNDTWSQPVGDTQDVMGYAPTYHPGTANVSEARAVAVGVGQRVVSVDVALAPGRAARISGHARDSQGRPLRTVSLEQSFRGPGGASFRSVGNTTAAASDGSFTIRNVPPGEYALMASAAGTGESLRQSIVVNGEDIDGITLTATTGWRISGHLIGDDGTAPAIARDRLRITGRMISWPVGLGTPGARNPSDDMVAEDWTFRTTPLFGAAQLRVAGLPDGWGVKAIYREGREITDATVELGSGEELGSVQVVLTDKLSMVSGQLVDQKGVPLTDGTVLVFAADPQRWTDGSRWVASARPDQSGRYQFRGLPAGAYVAIALDYVEEGIWNDGAYLASIRDRAVRFVLGEAASHSLALRIAAP